MLRALLLLSVTSLAACDVGEVKLNGGMVDGGTVDGPGGASAAKIAAFDTSIKPMVVALGCLDAGCHGGTQPPVLNTFDSVGAKYKTGPGGMNNIFVTKGGAANDHNGPYFDATQKATVAAWIDMQ